MAMDLTQSVLIHLSIKIGNLEVSEIQQLKEVLKQKEEKKTAE